MRRGSRLVSVEVSTASLLKEVNEMLSKLATNGVAGAPVAARVAGVTSDAPRVLVLAEICGAACTALRGIRSGRFQGVVLRQEAGRLLAATVEAVSNGLFVASPEAQTVLGQVDDLSGRQLEILDGVAQGLSNEELALRCHVSLATVKREIAWLRQSFGVTRRDELEWLTLPHRRRRASPGVPAREVVDGVASLQG